MSRLIDADALRNAMYHEAFESDTNEQKWDSGCWIRYKMFERILKNQPTIGGLISVNECSSCRYWDSKSGLSARMCKQFNGFTTQHEFCSRWKPKEEE